MHIKKTDRLHPLDVLLNELDIRHHRTPRYNGKVERNHRNDQQRFYSYDDLLKQMKSYLNRFNNIVMQVLDWISPIEKNVLKKS